MDSLFLLIDHYRQAVDDLSQSQVFFYWLCRFVSCTGINGKAALLDPLVYWQLNSNRTV
mgnify:CR=1 FL=1